MPEAMAKKPKQTKKPTSNVISLVSRRPVEAANPSMPDPPAPAIQHGTKGYPSAVQMLQATIDDIEAGRVNPKDVFVGMYYDDPDNDTKYFVHVRRYNLTPLELVGRLSHILRDIDP